LLLIVTGDKKTQETVSWISLSNGLTTLTTTTSTSTCPLTLRKIRINVEIFLPRQGGLTKAKRQKQFSKNIKKKLKSGKKVTKKIIKYKSYQKKYKIKKRVLKKIHKSILKMKKMALLYIYCICFLLLKKMIK
jgi:hypothetical protein